MGWAFHHAKIEELILWLQERKRYLESQGWSNLEVKFDSGGWDEPHDINIYGTREETDKEYAFRMKCIEKETRQEQVKLQEHMKFVKKEAERLGIIKA